MIESNNWNKKPYWLRGGIIGLIIGFVLWISIFIYLFITAGSFSSLSKAISNVSIEYGMTSIILLLTLSLLIILVLFSSVWVGIGGLYQYIKTKQRISDYAGFGFGIGLFIIIFISIFNSFYGRLISEEFFLFIKESRWILYLIILISCTSLGLISGMSIKKFKK